MCFIIGIIAILAVRDELRAGRMAAHPEDQEAYTISDNTKEIFENLKEGFVAGAVIGGVSGGVLGGITTGGVGVIGGAVLGMLLGAMFGAFVGLLYALMAISCRAVISAVQ